VSSTTVETEAITLERRSMTGEVLGTVELDPTYFGVPVNMALLHQVVTAQLANRRAGTQSTKTRAEVAGGASKPLRQKGTGNARQGSIRAPHYAGGGVALGPKPRKYTQRTPRKMVQHALRCALSDRARSGELRLVDELRFEVPKTREAIALLGALECDGRVLVVVPRDAESVVRSFRNLPHVVTLPADQLTAYDVLGADVVVFSDETLPGATVAAVAAPAARRRRAAVKTEDEEPKTTADAEPSVEDEEAVTPVDATPAESTPAESTSAESTSSVEVTAAEPEDEATNEDEEEQQ
jgi:large subunit ribosomal protein L4